MPGSPVEVPGPFAVRPGYVLDGLTIAIAPPDARFSSGISIFAQPELNVPTRPTMFELLAYACAFAVHFAASQLPAWAVESSQDWNPTVHFPAFQLCSLRA